MSRRKGWEYWRKVVKLSSKFYGCYSHTLFTILYICACINNPFSYQGLWNNKVFNDSSLSGFHHVSYSHDNCSNNNDSHSYLNSQFAEGFLINYVARWLQK